MRFLPLVLLGLSLPLAAQTSFGVKAGINVSDVSVSDDFDEGEDTSPRLGFVGGLTADVPISPVLSFRPEVLYAQKGFSSDFDDFGADGSVTFELDYIEVPLLLAYTYRTPSALEFSIEAGPTLAYKLSEGFGCDIEFEEDLGEDDFCDEIEDENDDEDVVRNFDLSGAIGVTVGSGPFGVGLRYTNSLLSIAEDDEGADEDFSVRNRVFSVTAHYRFGR